MPYPELTSSRHLVQPPRFLGPDRRWHDTFEGTSQACTSVTWDLAALLSVPSYNYVCTDRTLVTEVSRQPWLSTLTDDGGATLEPIPPHQLRWMDQRRIADELQSRLEAELASVCRERRRIYLLLSGGLDSRVVAGALAAAQRRGELACKPVGVTWGLADSRDYEYGREVARILDFDWVHVPLEPGHLLENVEATATLRGCLVPPNYLHRALWFRDAEPDALVLAGSYGDMVGRGEFSGRTILELERHSVRDAHGLLMPEFAAQGCATFADDVTEFQRRAPGQFEYVYCEREQHGFYTRGSLAMALSVIGHSCDVYQAFTHPDVYSFMWSLHPALRTDEPYARLLQLYDERLVRLPWARTNRALVGTTSGRKPGLRREYHEYAAWVQGPLHDRLRELVDPQWFAKTGVFDGASIERLESKLLAANCSVGASVGNLAWIYLWLASIRLMVEKMSARGTNLAPPVIEKGVGQHRAVVGSRKVGLAMRWLRRRPELRRWLKRMYVKRLRRASVKRFPPEASQD